MGRRARKPAKREKKAIVPRDEEHGASIKRLSTKVKVFRYY